LGSGMQPDSPKEAKSTHIKMTRELKLTFFINSKLALPNLRP
jgi:hypothetical protein